MYQFTEQTIEGWINEYVQKMATDIEQNEDGQYYAALMLQHVKNGKISKLEMLRDTQSVFIAGVDTTAQSLEQLFFYLAKKQQIQERLYQELKAHKQKYGEFSLEHINKLHILRAVVYEALRHIVHVTNSMMRYVAQNDLKIGGYNIPKGWTVVANHYYINHHPRYWEKPQDFYIEHFLGDDNKFKLNKHFITFGSGKRDCVGQTLAIKNMNLLVGHMILRYKILPSDEKLFASLENVGLNGFTPKTMSYIIQLRDKHE